MSSEPSFAGTRRYTPTRVIGAGSWGRVFQAYDNERNAFVAVKLLQRASPDALMRFKREFRSLQDLVHPNLVTLYELLSDQDQWFFTMELVDGKTFLEHVRGHVDEEQPESTLNQRGPATTETVDSLDKDIPARRLKLQLKNGKRAALPADGIARLRDALGQLVDGLCALHAAGKLHRDVKPSNVLVAKDGRVVMLDFGLVHELSEVDESLKKGMVVGTPAYMSPEQAGGARLDESSDWYAVGVLLYESLTGQVPFEGSSTQMLKARRSADPPPPNALAHGVPDDLNQLCVQLLHRAPAERPKGWQLIERLKRQAPVVKLDGIAPLFGRDGDLDGLRGAHAWVRERKAPALVSLEAEAGLGKTALLQHFLAEVRWNDRTALVLHGTCGERESVPFKAFDGAIDMLATQLAQMPNAQLKPLMPRDARSLMRLFPVLERLKAALPDHAAEVPADQLEIRRRGFAALRQLMFVLARQRTVVLALDDLHFGDEDSATLLTRLLEAPALPILTIGAFRSQPQHDEDSAVHALEEAAFSAAGVHNVQITRVVLAPLPVEAARLLAQVHGAPPDRVEVVVREAKGNPLLVAQLASLATESASTLADWAKKRIAQLPLPARHLLEVVSMAQRPIDRLVAWHAAGLDTEASDPLMALRAARLVASDGDRLVPYQRDIGLAVRDAMPEAERKRLLVALADALASSPKADFESVAEWALEAGQPLRASVAFEKAAERAEEVLAFDRAARLYERAEAGRPSEDVARIQRSRARALAGAGRGKLSAAIYLKLASTADRAEALLLRQRAAEQLLYSGHVDSGIAVMSEVLAALGEPLPKSDAMSRAWGLLARMRADLNTLTWRVKPKDEWNPAVLMRTDAYWAAAKGFSLVDPVRGTSFQFTHFRHALDCGDPYRIARALAMEAGFHALIGYPHQDACLKALELLAKVLKDHPSDHAEGLAAMMAGCAALGVGRFEESARHFDYAVSLFKEKCPQETWEISSSLQYLAWALQNLGEYDQVRRAMTEVKEWAQARGDAYALTNFRVRVGPVVRLMDADPKGARVEIATALESFSRAGYFTQHLWGFLGEVQALLYEGRHAEALERERTEWPKLRRSGLLRVQLTRVLIGYLRGQLAALDPKSTPQQVERLARLLLAEKTLWSKGLAHLVFALAKVRAGNTASALEQLELGAAVLDETGSRTHAMAARLAASELRGAIGGSDAWFDQRGVKQPPLFARAFFMLPGV